MPICISCSSPVSHLYTTYSKADDRSLGKGVRLTQCPNCKRFADKYVEHDFVVLFIDLVLIKPQVYRHLLFNRLGRSDDKLDPAILRLGILLVLFDVYITWARIERNTNTTPSPNSGIENGNGTIRGSRLSDLPILTQYMFFLTMNIAATVVQHGVIRTLARVVLARSKAASTATITAISTREAGGSISMPPAGAGPGSNSSLPSSGAAVHQSNNANTSPAMNGIVTTSPPPTTNASHDSGDLSQNPTHTPTPTPIHIPTPSAISTALLVSSCTKLFPILLVIWPTQQDNSSSSSIPTSNSSRTATSEASKSLFSRVLQLLSLGSGAGGALGYVGWAVLVNNIEALLILLDCGYVIATFLAVAGVVARWSVEGWFMGLVGAG